MKKLFFFTQILLVLMLCSCGQNKPSEKQISKKSIIVVDSLYKVTSEKDHVDPNFGFNKCNLEIELKKIASWGNEDLQEGKSTSLS